MSGEYVQKETQGERGGGETNGEVTTGLCGCTILTLRQNEQMKEQRFLSAPSTTAISARAGAPPHPWRGACSPSLHLGESVRV